MQISFEDWLREYQRVCVAFGKLEAEHALAARKYVQETGGLRLEILRLECRVEELTADLNTAREQLAETTAQPNDLQHELAIVTTDRDTFRDGLHELKKEFDKLQQQLAQVTAERDAAIRQRDRLREQLEKIDRAAVSCATAGEVLKKLDELPPVAVAATPPWSHWKVGTRLVKGPMRTEIRQRGTCSLADGSSREEFRILGNTRWFEPSHLYSIGWREQTETAPPEPSGEEPIAMGPNTETAPETAPAPEWTLWELDQTIEATDGSRIILTEDNLGEWPRWYRQGFRRKKSPETAPEPYQWQDGDTVSSRDVKILPYGCLYKVKRLSCGRVALIGLTGMLSQADWEKHGFTLYRKASDPLPSPQLPPDPAPEPYQWQVGDIIESSSFTRRRVEEMHCGGVVLEGMGEPLPQQEWERRGFKLHRKASELPDLPPLTEQQVEAFAEVAEPVDDSTGAGEGQS